MAPTKPRQPNRVAQNLVYELTQESDPFRRAVIEYFIAKLNNQETSRGDGTAPAAVSKLLETVVGEVRDVLMEALLTGTDKNYHDSVKRISDLAHRH